MSEQLILVVEDNPDQMELTVLTLEAHDVKAEIVKARDGAEALEFLLGQGNHSGRDTHRQPNFVLLDMKLPKLSGLDVLRAMRGNPITALVPVVMLTSSSERSDNVACYAAGANSFIRKPVDFGQFTTKLDCVQTYWLSVNELAAPN